MNTVTSWDYADMPDRMVNDVVVKSMSTVTPWDLGKDLRINDLVPRVINGDVISVLNRLPEHSVHMIVTSSPYYNLRDYSICGCAVRRLASEEFMSMDGANRKMGGGGPIILGDPRCAKEPDSTCPHCHGTGRIEGLDSIWGGKSDCQHEWGDAISIKPYAGGNRGAPEDWKRKGRGISSKTDNRGCFCLKCNGWRGHLGLEPTPELFIEHLVEVARAARRVLRPDGVMFFNIGDTYSGGPSTGMTVASKSLMLIPQELAVALKHDGWIIRGDLWALWHKICPMPSSAKDRPTVSHEYVWAFSPSEAEVELSNMLMLVPQEKYFYDNRAVREPYAQSTLKEINEIYGGKGVKDYDANGVQNPSDTKRRIIDNLLENGGANIGTVWEMSTGNFGGEHYAAFSPELPKRAILLGTSEKGVCPTCGKQWVRVVKKGFSSRNNTYTKYAPGTQGARLSLLTKAYRNEYGRHDYNDPAQPLGWMPQCKCYGFKPELPEYPVAPEMPEPDRGSITPSGLQSFDPEWVPDAKAAKAWADFDEANKQYEAQCEAITTERMALLKQWAALPTVPAVVMDLFAGSGTTLLVARSLGRRSIGIEISPVYCNIIKERLASAQDIEVYGNTTQQGGSQSG